MDDKMPMEKLLDVQKVDLKIRDMETESAAIPRKIQERDAALDRKKTELADLRDAIEENRKAQRKFERQLEKKQEELSKYNSQLPMIKTNREYKAILVEIEAVEKEMSDIEEEILKVMVQLEGIESQVKLKESEAREVEEQAEREKEELRQNQRALEESLEGTRSERESLVIGLDGGLLSQYDKIRVRKGGLAIAPIEDESCGACHMALPPQVVNETIGGQIKICPSCSRLLYWDEMQNNL